jgi:two-component system cell cycle sensor histidine kinase/response regulator CckA
MRTVTLPEGLTGDLVTKPDGQIVACNRRFAEMFGFDSVDAARSGNVRSLLRSRKQGEELLDLVRQQQMIDGYELEMRRHDGEALYAIARIVGEFDERGALAQLRVFLFNDTKRKRVEQQLVQGQKMESLGTLAGGIAHDFNNILAIILGSANRLELAAVRPEELPRAVHAIKEAVDRGAALVQQLLTAAQQSDVRLAPFDLNALIVETADMLRATFPKTIAFEFDLDPRLPPVAGDRSQMQHVLLNLCANARDAMGDGGTLAVATRIAPSSEVAEQFTGSDARDYAVLEVRDTGSGMSREVRAHIFEPFFTTKERGKGTGLGLSVVYGVVNHHGGFISVDSEAGAGATFHIYLPVAVRDATTGADKHRGTAEEGEQQIILLVEDEDMLRDLGVTFLEAEGYRVLIARDGVEAVDTFEAHRDEIGLVLCDLGLPRMGGREAFLKMKQSRPAVRVIVASGYLEPSVRSDILRAGVIDTIQKPYDFRELVAKVRAVIGPPRKLEEHPQLF